MIKPLLNPPCSGWREDLEAPYVLPVSEPLLGRKTPNYQSLIYLELPRSTGSARGVLFVLVFLMSPMLLFNAYSAIFEFDALGSEFIPIRILQVGLVVWITTFGIRVDIAPPRDSPIRFNRARQKIYAYNFKHQWWNPFGKWGVVPVSYDWSQVRAERWSRTGVVSGGLIFKWGVELSIIKPGTNEVIDRFNLSTMDADVKTWAYICTYMQQGPTALPIPGEPKDHNDVLWYEFALLLAPKVTWPPDMDLESRTAP